MNEIERYSGGSGLDHLRLADLTGAALDELLLEAHLFHAPSARTSPVILSELPTGERRVGYPEGLAQGEVPITPWTTPGW